MYNHNWLWSILRWDLKFNPTNPAVLISHDINGSRNDLWKKQIEALVAEGVTVILSYLKTDDS